MNINSPEGEVEYLSEERENAHVLTTTERTSKCVQMVDMYIMYKYAICTSTNTYIVYVQVHVNCSVLYQL